jgi:hypothetical protein
VLVDLFSFSKTSQVVGAEQRALRLLYSVASVIAKIISDRVRFARRPFHLPVEGGPFVDPSLLFGVYEVEVVLYKLLIMLVFLVGAAGFEPTTPSPPD